MHSIYEKMAKRLVEEAEIEFDGKSFKQFWHRPGTFVILDQGNVRGMVSKRQEKCNATGLHSNWCEKIV